MLAWQVRGWTVDGRKRRQLRGEVLQVARTRRPPASSRLARVQGLGRVAGHPGNGARRWSLVRVPQAVRRVGAIPVGLSPGQPGKAARRPRVWPGLYVERERGVEPPTLCLGSRCSAAELLPLDEDPAGLPTAPEERPAYPKSSKIDGNAQARPRLRNTVSATLFDRVVPLQLYSTLP